MQHSNPRTHEQGLVSILTVLMFSILIGILLTGFTRIALQEQQDTLQDDLSKGAYNSAQAGVEDAKRAIQFCSANPGSNVGGKDCTNLYNQSCPGFNSGGAFTGLGIASPPVGGSGTQVGDPNANQRYTCVIISPSTDIVTTLSDSNTTENTTMYRLKGASAYNRVEISWHGPSQPAAVLASAPAGTPALKNVRHPDWLYPAVLRTSLLATNANMSAFTERQMFLYPVSSGGTTSTGMAGSAYQYVNCSTGTTYACTLSIDVSAIPPTHTERFITLQPFYREATVSIKLFNGAASTIPVPIEGEQLTIDSTGAAGNLFRRVQTRVAAGNPIATSSALDVGNSICKNFFVSAVSFNNACAPTPGSGKVAAANIAVNPPGANALLGGWCSVNACVSDPSTPKPDPTDYEATIYNLSSNDPSQVASCEWTISDGTTISNQHCNKGDSFDHEFPFASWPPKVPYTVTLKIQLTNGASATYDAVFWIPQ